MKLHLLLAFKKNEWPECPICLAYIGLGPVTQLINYPLVSFQVSQSLAIFQCQYAVGTFFWPFQKERVQIRSSYVRKLGLPASVTYHFYFWLNYNEIHLHLNFEPGKAFTLITESIFTQAVQIFSIFQNVSIFS